MRTILLDIDGVIADLYTPFLQFLRDKFGLDLKLEQWNQYGIRQCLGDIAADAFGDWLEQPNLYDQVEPMEEASLWGVERLRQIGRVVAVSLAYPGHASSKLKWLIERFGFGWEDIVLTPSKELVLGDILIEDNTTNILRYQAAHGKPAILMSRPWNADFNTTPEVNEPAWTVLRADDIYEVVASVDHLIREGKL